MVEQNFPLRWQDCLHVVIQERSSEDTVHLEVGNDQERYPRAKRTNTDVQLELAESFHRPIRCVDERRAPCGFDGGAPRFCHTAKVD